MEVQNHGVVFEDQIIKSITGLSKKEYQELLENAYTASMDIKKDTKSDRDYSIKVSKDGKSLGCGDILRFNQHCSNGEFTIVVGAWKQLNSTTKQYYEIIEFDISPKDYAKFWSGITYEILKPFVDYVKSIPPGKEGQMANRRVWKQKRTDIYEQFGRGLVNIDAKIDSKEQRRVQCSIKVQELINQQIPHRKYIEEYKGIKLPYEQQSAPRQFS